MGPAPSADRLPDRPLLAGLQALGAAVQQAVAGAKVSPADVVAFSIDTTCCTVVALDEGEGPFCSHLSLRAPSLHARACSLYLLLLLLLLPACSLYLLLIPRRALSCPPTTGGAALRPALLWMDMRSAPQAARVAACADPALAVNGGGAGPVSAEWMIPKALWLQENEPETFAAAAHICEYQVCRGGVGGRRREEEEGGRACLP